MIVGQKARVTKNKTREKESIDTSTGRIYALTKHIITIEFLKDEKVTHREAFNVADIIEGIATIEVKQGKEWTRVDKSYFGLK